MTGTWVQTALTVVEQRFDGPLVEPVRRVVPVDRTGLPMYLLGGVLLGGTASHLLLTTQWMVTDMIESGLAVLFSLTIFYGGYRLTTSDLSLYESLQVTITTLGFLVLGIAVSGEVIVIRALEGMPVENALHVVLLSGTAAAAVGVPVGFYYHELQTSQTELAAQYERTRTLNKQLATAERVLRHNLAQELTVLLGRSEMLLDCPLAPDAHEHATVLADHISRLETLHTNARRLRQVWNEDGAGEQDAAEVVAACVTEAKTAFADADITATYPEQAPVVAHPRLSYAVDEAIENAVIHTAEDVAVEVRVVPEEGPAGATRIEVADTGEGIPQLELQALDDAAETQFTHGRGLGLWLIYWVVKDSGGQLRFDENDTHGTILRMDLPTPVTTE